MSRLPRATLATALTMAWCMAWLGPAAALGDPDLERQYGLEQIGASEAWTLTRGEGVVIAVIDTGIDGAHEDLAANLLPAYNASRRSTAGTGDDNGHGTHVAGTAAAVLGNGRGGAGVAPAAKVLAIKVFDGTPVEATGEIAVAIRYALAQGAQVINLSITSLYPDLPVSDLELPCNDAFINGALCVIAAGNRGESRSSGFSPDLNAVVVTAHDSRGTHARFASRADTKWALSAPGVGVYSTVPGGSYASKDGTSMAAPHVAGAAALLFARGLTNREVAERLIRTATATINPVVDGAGRLDAAAALGVARREESAPPAPHAPPTPAPAPTRPSTPATTMASVSGSDPQSSTRPGHDSLSAPAPVTTERAEPSQQSSRPMRPQGSRSRQAVATLLVLAVGAATARAIRKVVRPTRRSLA